LYEFLAVTGVNLLYALDPQDVYANAGDLVLSCVSDHLFTQWSIVPFRHETAYRMIPCPGDCWVVEVVLVEIYERYGIRNDP